MVKMCSVLAAVSAVDCTCSTILHITGGEASTVMRALLWLRSPPRQHMREMRTHECCQLVAGALLDEIQHLVMLPPGLAELWRIRHLDQADHPGLGTKLGDQRQQSRVS